MERIADEAKVVPMGMNFAMMHGHTCLALIDYVFTSPGAIAKRLRELQEHAERFILPRDDPCALKVKMSSYATKR